MLDDIAVVLASVGTASTAVALLRRRVRRARSLAALAPLGVGVRHLADALCSASSEPLPVADHAWRSIAETLELEADDTLH